MNRLPEPGDFASAAMMRLIMAGLGRQNISIPAPKLSGARVPLGLKRQLLESIEKTHGISAIVGIADALERLPEEPVLLALARATSVQDLLMRWRRMERFSHGRHFIDIDVTSPHFATIQHRALIADKPPVRCESALVIAVISLLCERVVAGPVMVTSSSGEIARSSYKWTGNLPVDWSVRFTLAAPSVVISEPVLSTKSRSDEAEILNQLVASDPVRRWSIREMAVQLGVSSRTLQRKLNDQQTSASEIIRRVRLNLAATQMLESPNASLAEIGFLCGFSDQAHFTRTFTLHVGTTPNGYRAGFAT
jgi:AraC-like DNA-binding protein